MAAEISSESGAQSDSVQRKLPPMPSDLYSALMSEGKENDIIEYLGLSEDKEVKLEVQEDAADPTPQGPQRTETKKKLIIRYDIQCATVESGDTALHLLVRKGNDDLALKVFRKEMSLVNAQNKNLETPLHIAARTAGRKKIVCELIKLNSEFVKVALAKENCNGDTALHIAARHGNTEIGRELMRLDPPVVRKANHKGSSPLYVAIDNRCNKMVQTMLQEDPTLVYTLISDGMYPIHVAARNGNKNLIKHIMGKYPTYANLLDHLGRNFFHIAAIENQADIFEISQIKPAELLALSQHWKSESIAAISEKMNQAADYEGNTPLHIAATKGHRLTMSVIYKNDLELVAQTMQNHEGCTPLELSARQVEKNSKIKDIKVRISRYISDNGDKFTSRWFEDIMAPSDENKWERTQVIGLGSVLITTITFAAAFTIPGGYDQNDGTPILGRTIAYKAFTIANILSFILAFTSLYTLISSALVDPDYAHLKDATDTFTASAGFMVLAFGLGSYVMLVPVSFPIAIIALIITIPLGSPYMSPAVTFYKSIFKFIMQFTKGTLEFCIPLSIPIIGCSSISLVILLVPFAIFVGILKLTLR